MITWINSFGEEWKRRGMTRVKYTAGAAFAATKATLLFLGITIGHEKLWWLFFVVLVGIFEWFVDVDEAGRLQLTPQSSHGKAPSIRFVATMALSTVTLFVLGLGAYSAFDFLRRTESIRVSVFDGGPQIDSRGFAYGLAEHLAEQTGVSSTVADTGASQFVLEGQFVREGQKTFAVARLRDSRSGRLTAFDKREVRASAFDTVSEAAQNAIARDVARKLYLGLPIRRRLIRQRNDASAVWWYAQAMRRLEHWSPPSFVRADSLFHTALKKDADFAPARGGIAYTHALRALFSDSASHEFAVADSLALDVLRTNPDLSEGLLAHGLVLLYRDVRYAAAGVALREAVQRSPSLPAARFWYGSYLTAAGRFEAARAEFQAATAMAPSLEPARTGFGQMLYYSGRYPAAESMLVTLAYSSACRRDDETLYSAPAAHLFLGRTLAAQGRAQEAEAVLDNLLDRCSGIKAAPPSRLDPCKVRHALWEVFRADAMARQGKVAAADSLVLCVRTMLASSLPPYSLAVYYAGRASQDAARSVAFSDSALKWLEKGLHACAPSDPMAVSFAIEPAFTRLRQSSRYAALAQTPRRERTARIGDPRPITASVESHLDTADPAAGNRYVETFTFSGRKGQVARLTLASDEFDTFLTLGRVETDRPGSPMTVVACSDDNSLVRTSRFGSLFQYDLQHDGTYMVQVSSAGRNQTGAYRLSLEWAQPS